MYAMCMEVRMIVFEWVYVMDCEINAMFCNVDLF